MVLQRTTPRTRFTGVDMLAAGCYLLAAVLLYSPLWMDLRHGYLLNSMQDQNMFEWFFAVAAKSTDLFSTLENHPFGVNMMANTSMLGLGIPLAPVTWLFGPTVTWAVVLTGGIAGSAAGWYWVISRYITRPGVGAAIGGAFCAFAPPMVSHANAHPNFTALFVLPFIVLQLIKLVNGGNPVRHGIWLGLLLAYQVFLGEEPLLIAATALVIYACARRSVLAKSLFSGLGVAALVALALVVYPLWTQFFGPQSYSGMTHGEAGNDVAAITGFASVSIAGDPALAQRFAANPTEENGFFGWPLVILVAVLAIWLWRVASARALVITAAAMAILSLGGELVVNGEKTGITLPWHFVSQFPLYDSLLCSRFAMACVPVIGILLAMACERIETLSRNATHTPLRLIWFGALVAILLPIAPTPLSVAERPETPAFFTDGIWRQYVPPDRSVVMVPIASSDHSLPMHWQTDADLGFPIAEGYFVGPGENGKGHYGAVQRPTSRLLEQVGRTGSVPAIGPDERDQARRDLEFWHAGAVVLGPDPRLSELRAACEALFGPGVYVGGVWVWFT
jgi:hypothetical protein